MAVTGFQALIVPRRISCSYPGTFGPCRALGTLLCLLAAVPGIAQQWPLDPPKARDGLTAASPSAVGDPNPYLSLLPPDAVPDYGFWRDRIRVESAVRARATQKAPLLEPVPEVRELEPADRRGDNDTPILAESLPEFGTAPGLQHAADVIGHLYAPPAQVLVPQEDDGSIPLANETGLQPGQRVRYAAQIGDGPFGSEGAGSGDYDVYHVGPVLAGQLLTIDIDTNPSNNDRLDSRMGLFSADGALLVSNDNESVDSPDPFLELAAPEDGDYFVVVRGINSIWPQSLFDSGSGVKVGSEGTYRITIGLDAGDVDGYGLDLRAGDVLGVRVEDGARAVTVVAPSGQERMGSDLDGSALLPERSPLPGGGNASLAFVVETDGRYAVITRRGEGPYVLRLRVFRPPLEASPGLTQILFLDFDGADLDARRLFSGGSEVHLSPLTSFLGNLGLDPTPGGTDESRVIDHVLATVSENLVEDLRDAPFASRFQLRLLNSRDHADPFGSPGASRVIVGGSRDEFGLNIIALSESVDVGNFVLEETSVVLLDRLTTPGESYSLHPLLDRGLDPAALLGFAIGTVAAHEAGHILANFHTGHPEAPVNLMDGRPNLLDFLGVGSDGWFGTEDDVDVDLGPAPYHVNEGFTGIQDTKLSLALGLVGPGATASVEPGREFVAGPDLSPAYPNPSAGETRLTLRLDRAQPVRVALYDLQGRLVRLVREGLLPEGPTPLAVNLSDLPAGPYLIRAMGAGRSLTRPVVRVP